MFSPLALLRRLRQLDVSPTTWARTVDDLPAGPRPFLPSPFTAAQELSPPLRRSSDFFANENPYPFMSMHPSALDEFFRAQQEARPYLTAGENVSTGLQPDLPWADIFRAEDIQRMRRAFPYDQI